MTGPGISPSRESGGAKTLLLRLYPADWPRDEMLGVLVANNRPLYREFLPLVFGGLRARTGGHQTFAQRWLYAARAAALMLLTLGAATPMPDLQSVRTWLTGAQVLVWIAAALAAAAVIAGRRLFAFPFALTALVLASTVVDDWWSATSYALAAVLLLIPGRRTPVLNPLLIALPIVVTIGNTALWEQSMLVAVLLWTLFDERLLLAIGLTFCVSLIQAVGVLSADNSPGAIMFLLTWRLSFIVGFLAVGALLARHRARI